MEPKIIELKQWSLQMRDLIIGGILAAITPMFTILLQTVQGSLKAEHFELVVNWPSILNVGVITFVAYLSKNYASPAKLIVPTTNAASADTKEVIKQTISSTPIDSQTT